MRDKALELVTEYAKTIGPDGDAGMRHYPFDKLVCGLVDLQSYAGHRDAGPVLERVTASAVKNFERVKLPLADPSHNQHYYGLPQEWYTLAENLYRAYRLTGEPMFRRFADEWIYHAYWGKFAASDAPADAHGVHAYSHVNSFSSGGMKVYNWDTYTCCSGSYIQNIADYHNLIYFKDAESLYVNLYLPSEVIWKHPSGEIRVVQETKYPDADTVTFTVSAQAPARFALRFRVPAWTRGMSVKVNGADTAVDATPGRWAAVTRAWADGDRIDLRIPLILRMEPVDRQHPDRVAVVRGPVVFVLEGSYHDPNFRLPMRDEELETWLVAEAGTLARGVWAVGAPETDFPTILRVELPDKKPVRLRFRPFYEIGENYPYFMYFDRRALPWRLW